MTREEREEAIYQLERCIHNAKVSGNRYSHFELAIEALKAEPCEDAISRQAVLKTLDDMDNVLDEDRTIENYKELLKECYKVLPPVNPQPCEDAISRCGEQMDFPDTFEEFAEQYKIIDKEEVYTNGIELIPVFRVKQWLEYIKTGQMTGDEWVDDVVESMKGETSHTIIPQEEMDALLSGLGDMYEPYKESEGKE